MPPNSWDGSDFTGAKLAALHDGGLLTYRRDRKPGIPFPGMIDLPGGGREGTESPTDCALRELAEEFGITVPAARVHYVRRYELSWYLPRPSFFLAVDLTAAEIAAVVFGDEGEDWRLLAVDEFLSHAEAIPHLQDRVMAYLDGR
jgi:8-oxo-dGTP diphosphatase